MNSVHDMGGMHGFGPVQPEHDEPTFHETWEGRMLGMSRSLGYAGAWNVHMARAARESLNPVDYLSNLTDPWYFEQFATCEIRLATGSGPYEESRFTHQLSQVLSRKGIRHYLDDWGPRGGHDWPYWKDQMREYLSRW